MQPQKKKSHTVVLLIGWLIILGSYLLIRLAFILFGLHLRSEALGVCLAVIPYLLAALYFGKYGKSQKAWFYSLGILFPSIVFYRCVSLRDNSCKYRRSYGSCRNRGCICKSLYTAVRTLCNQYFVFQLDVHSMWHCGFCSLRSYSHEGAKEHRK